MPSVAFPKTEFILWDVVEEHFEEAAFLFGQWESALYSPKFDLAGLEKLEQRIEAHVDGLIVGGTEVARRILDPELTNGDDPGRATVAALALLFTADQDIAGRIIDTAVRANEPLQQALIRALVLVDLEFMDSILLNRFQTAGVASHRAALLETLTGRGIEVELPDEWSASSDPNLIGAVLDSTARFARNEWIALAEEHLTSSDPVRAKALRAAIALDSDKAWCLCRELAQQPDAADPDALVYIALLGKPTDHEILYKQLERPGNPEQALWALAYTGTLRAGDSSLNALESKNERVAKAAAEALSWIGGFDNTEQRFRAQAVEPGEQDTLPPLEVDDLDATLEPDGLDLLPVPNRAVIAEWWKQNRGCIAQQARNILGCAGGSAVMHALEAGSLWRRHGLTFEMTVLSGGRQHVSTDAFSVRQRRQLAAIAGQLPRMEA
jgi:uncharacterized protein (TIGR02270 family)